MGVVKDSVSVDSHLKTSALSDETKDCRMGDVGPCAILKLYHLRVKGVLYSLSAIEEHPDEDVIALSLSP